MQATELVRDYISAWNRRDPAGIVSLLTSNGCIWKCQYGPMLNGFRGVEFCGRGG